MRFTDKSIQALRKRTQRYEIVEDGGTGLAVRVSPKGVRTFSYLYRFDGKARRLTLGVYRDRALDASLRAASHDPRGLPYLTLADAWIKLAEAKKKRDSGINPGAEAVVRHKAERKAQTVGELIDAYVEKWAKLHKRPSSAAEDERMLNKDVRPAWGDRKASSITRQDVIALLDGIVGRGAPVAANRALAVVRKMFRWAVRQGIIAISPASEIDNPGGKEIPRERVLSDAEIAEVWRASEQIEAPYSQFVRMLLITGQRRGEVAGMRSQPEIDLDAKLWTIPRMRTKNGVDHEIPLSALALETLKMLPRSTNCVFVSGRRGDQPISNFKNTKRELDALILEARRDALRSSGRDPAEVEPMPRWTMHDLRRTMRTNLSKLRLDPEICERVIGHVPKGVRRTYDVHQYRDEKREILNAWAMRLRRIVSAEPAAGGKVVRLRSAAQ